MKDNLEILIRSASEQMQEDAMSIMDGMEETSVYDNIIEMIASRMRDLRENTSPNNS